MKTNFFKKIFFVLVLLLTLMLPVSLVAKAASDFPTDQILYLTASVGETYDRVGISYHTASDDSYILYGTSVVNGEIANPTKVIPTSTLWSYDKLASDPSEYGFSSRYVCKATLTNLERKTTYYYQAVDGNVKSAINSFESLTDDTEAKSFLFLTDIQSSGSGFKNAQNLLDAIFAKTDEDPNLLFMTGDQVDRSGIEQQWKDYYTYIPTISNTLQANLPGNHEYYNTNGGGYINNEIYNQMTNNPLNGPEDRLGSSYYFMYGNILFIMLDIVKIDYNVSLQQEWFKEVVKNNPAKWIIVGSHPGMYATGAYASDSSTVRKNWLSVFEECQVDIAFNGHEHVYARKNLRYGGSSFNTNAGEVDESLGVTYLAGGAAGLKLYGEKAQPSLLEDFDYYDKFTNNTGCVVTVDGDELTVKRYKASGMIDDEFTLYAKRPDQVTTLTDQEILDSFNISYDEDNSSVTINWDGNIYGNATNINIKGGNLKGNGVDLPVVTSSLDSKTWKGYFTSYNYYFTVTITKNDGTTLVKELELILNVELLDYKINYELDGGTNHPDNPATFKGTDLPLTLSEYLQAPTKPGYNFVGWILNDGKRVTDKVDLDELADITLKAVWELAPFKITYILDGGTNSVANPDDFFQEHLPKKLYSPKKEGYKFVGWELNGEIVTEIPASTNSDITLTALWQKTNCVITYVLNGGENNSSNPTSFNPSYLPIKLYEATKAGYVFGGWKLNDQVIFELPQGIVDDITLEAVWEQSNYNITYNLDGGENNSSNQNTYDVTKLPTKLANPTKDGYKFIGWKLNGKEVNEIPEGTKGDITLEAVWENSVYNITYNLDGGENNSSNPTKYDSEKLPQKLTNPTKEGYDFAGWKLNGKVVDEIPEGTTGDITLEATWNQIAKKKGCSKCSTNLIIAISLFASAVLLLKKKEH